MNRIFIAIWVAVALVAGFGLYQLKYKVQCLEGELHEVHLAIKKEKEKIHVLKAELEYLSSPQRIESLANKYLGLVPAQSNRIVFIKNLPFHHDLAQGLTGEKINPKPTKLQVKKQTVRLDIQGETVR